MFALRTTVFIGQQKLDSNPVYANWRIRNHPPPWR